MSKQAFPFSLEIEIAEKEVIVNTSSEAEGEEQDLSA